MSQKYFVKNLLAGALGPNVSLIFECPFTYSILPVIFKQMQPSHAVVIISEINNKAASAFFKPSSFSSLGALLESIMSNLHAMKSPVIILENVDSLLFLSKENNQLPYNVVLQKVAAFIIELSKTYSIFITCHAFYSSSGSLVSGSTDMQKILKKIATSYIHNCGSTFNEVDQRLVLVVNAWYRRAASTNELTAHKAHSTTLSEHAYLNIDFLSGELLSVTHEINKPASVEDPNILPSTTFKLTLNQKEEASRNQVVLPYKATKDEEIAKMLNSQLSRIQYEPDSYDDIDDDDPDDDLDI